MLTEDEWIKKIQCVHTHTHTHTHNEILLSHQKEWNNAICSNIDEPRDYHTKWLSQKKKNKYYIYHLDLDSKIQHEKNLFLKSGYVHMYNWYFAVHLRLTAL